jgi:hypothetical protein
VRFKSTAKDAVDTVAVSYRKEMHEIDKWLKHIERGENLTEKEQYQRELIAATLKMINIKTGGGLVRKKQ